MRVGGGSFTFIVDPPKTMVFGLPALRAPRSDAEGLSILRDLYPFAPLWRTASVRSTPGGQGFTFECLGSASGGPAGLASATATTAASAAAILRALTIPTGSVAI